MTTAAADVTALRPVTVLYTMPKSIYLGMPGVDCWGEDRDARLWPGGTPVVAHPPCRLWCKLRHFSTAPPEEKELARHAVRMVRECGGVLEHPMDSTLWPDQDLPPPGRSDNHGYTLAFPQRWFGHVAEKMSWFYVVGVRPMDLPDITLVLGYATHQVRRLTRDKKKIPLGKGESSFTPPALASWLVAVARLTRR